MGLRSSARGRDPENLAGRGCDHAPRRRHRPALDYVFLGPVKPEWTDTERSFRIFTAMGTGIIGSLVPYVLSPRPWAAMKEIERIRVAPLSGGTYLSYTLTF
ncbi:hypothetical protein AKJ09_03146 [Labilithrix luteola]|uniref:Uncharacterized protein n=1 Tax=Labilithrix luteola TaxID=1391654 RepID=A0A0K1PSI5_9BACT|nr:hypothetical protein [Labilithrix luteola]AKU96482.1 hypothetical protein AKJ09_03146 [Labilithrix luteola]